MYCYGYLKYFKPRLLVHDIFDYFLKACFWNNNNYINLNKSIEQLNRCQNFSFNIDSKNKENSTDAKFK